MRKNSTGRHFDPHLDLTKRERLKSALYLRLKKRKDFETCPGPIFEKLRKQFGDTQKVPFMLDKNRKPLFPQLKQKGTFILTSIFFFRKMSHSAEKCNGGTL